MMKRVRQFFLMLLPLLALAALAGLSACSPRKNTAASRNYQAFITRYNIYYNGDEHYKETLREMEKTYEDDYSQRLFMHPVEAKAKPKSPAERQLRPLYRKSPESHSASLDKEASEKKVRAPDRRAEGVAETQRI